MKSLTPALCIVFGAAAIAWGGASVWHDLVTVQRWPAVEADAMGTSTTSRQTGGRRSSSRSFGIAVTFAFPLNGRTVTAVTEADSPSFLYEWQAQIAATKRFPRGSRHRIWYDPENPREITTALPDTVGAWLTAGPLLFVGIVALGAGLVMARRPRTDQTRA